MTEPLKRNPYQAPQTSMELHIAELVDHLRRRTGTRSEFATLVERAMSHAFWLETECSRLRAENLELDNALAVGLPLVTSKYFEMDACSPVDFSTIEWRLEPLRWRWVLRPFQARASERTWARIRRSVFRGLIRRVRTEFEATFPTKPPLLREYRDAQ